MPEGQKTSALLDIVGVADALDQTRGLIVAASNLSAVGTDRDSDALYAVITAAEEKLDFARTMLAAFLGPKLEGAANV